MKAKLRARRSSLAIIITAPVRLAFVIAQASWGAIIFPAALDLDIFRRDPALASDVICNRLALRF